MSTFYYIVKGKLIRRVAPNGEIEFMEFEEKFENEEPILARKKAIQYYQNYIDVLLEAKEKKYLSDNQARVELQSFIHSGFKQIFEFSGTEIEFQDSIGNGLGIFLVKNKTQNDVELDDDEIFIHGIGRISHMNFPERLIRELEDELKLYRENGFSTADDEMEVVFCDSEEWEEGYLGNGQWLESYHEPNTYNILRTPFDWSGLDKPYWWRTDSDKDESAESFSDESKQKLTIKDIISDGESNKVEFKPTLLYNFKTQAAGIGIKNIIAKTICAFLNSNGGFLLIGITDDGEVQGLSHDFSLSEKKNEKDFFMLEFDQMLRHFLTFSVKSSVSGEFKEVDGKDIFVVTVTPSKRGPVFLNGKKSKEFYVRGEASTQQLQDIEQITNYCLENWGMK